MYRLMRFYNQNKKAIIRAILIIALFFILLIIFNNNAKNNNKTSNTNTSIEKVISNSVSTDRSLVTGESVDSKTINEDAQLIENFLNYCKAKDLKQAYSLISSSCKEQQFQTEEDFKNVYIDILFKNTNIIYTIENWYNNTYKITIKENALTTGKVAKFDKQDYITVLKEDGRKKLNVNNFINEKNINVQQNFNGIKVSIINEQQYMDYTIFNLEIENNTDVKVLMDDLENIKSIYIQDDNKAKYNLYTHEIEKKDLLILPKQSKKISLKFYSKYISTKIINKMVFSGVIVDYGTENSDQKTNYIIEI